MGRGGERRPSKEGDVGRYGRSHTSSPRMTASSSGTGVSSMLSRACMYLPRGTEGGRVTGHATWHQGK